MSRSVSRTRGNNKDDFKQHVTDTRHYLPIVQHASGKITEIEAEQIQLARSYILDDEESVVNHKAQLTPTALPHGLIDDIKRIEEKVSDARLEILTMESH